ncbi:adenine deaminase [Aspergillus caelatus]|uniref:Adenine deaminase n=1 Tax=Aspergillus caelatus TaxID=61420 RepID=A0A5N7A9V7_9EURO|nr:adenine deaminase [Aspergillus caelatus]KAE8366651.1 adenine deaminase [Aspergillus caelatus]
MDSIQDFIRGIPKVELHMHIEGCIEPEMMFALAERNGISLPWKSPEELQDAYRFDNLQSFLSLYFEGCKVLVKKQDFYDVTHAYLKRAHMDNVVRAELFIGPQTFTEKGIPLSELMEGVLGAIRDAEQVLGISAGLIVSTHRHRTEAEALELLESIMPWKEHIIGIGMGGAEMPNPPSKFATYFKVCRERGFRTCIHAGEEGPSDYVRQAVELLQVDRIDHGIACLSDPALVRELVQKRITLTVCPVSNLKLNVVSSLDVHPLRILLDAGLKVTINSDDPPYFGAYINDNFLQCHAALDLSVDQVTTLARNSINGSFLPEQEIRALISRLDLYCAEFQKRRTH